ncbi:ABC transporter ATP-binding protein [Enterovirga rhinocerotis]|uniref:Spermidine/putrescine import ATP-binding protein PotA n=1 Tax=Enterovirga rhinocerotis TaxID=1339210 RepID=A0A4R7BL87_9HYPH|nr:ABC transporter ATP-binding protein [Enterovirga rhinocerotis]TDR85382.1 putative spermidine/putrescine transport system ATP-binding protein/spermidine/putrescine transport system ATP-binding protein/mannopine transport system ATP-binding protein [Enterovirga rhinocerotis]
MIKANPSDAVGVDLRDVQKWYGSVLAVRGVSLAIAPGEMVCLLGPSGCGKTTTLRMIAGLEKPDAGDIRIGDTLVNAVSPWKRNIGMVFQNYALFPHMTVHENVAFGLTMRNRPAGEIRAAVEDAMAQVRLAGYGDRRPSQLSGGQRQRVALARAIVTKPNVLLLDEPLAALDKKLREQMQVEIRQLQRAVGITTVFVTHDQEEALTLADRIVVMEEGQIVQIGSPADVYERPKSRFVSDFIGFTNAVGGKVVSVTGTTARIETASGHSLDIPGAEGVAAGDEVDLVVRPEKVAIDPPEGSGCVVVEGDLVHTVYSGAVTYFHVDIGRGAILIAMAPNAHGAASALPTSGARLRLGLTPDTVLVFPRRG